MYQHWIFKAMAFSPSDLPHKSAGGVECTVFPLRHKMFDNVLKANWKKKQRLLLRRKGTEDTHNT